MSDSLASLTVGTSSHTGFSQQESDEPIATDDEWKPTCSHCGGAMEIVERLPARREATRGIDTS
jgi:hypothetical protein